MGLGRQLGRLNQGLHALLGIRALAERVLRAARAHRTGPRRLLVRKEVSCVDAAACESPRERNSLLQKNDPLKVFVARVWLVVLMSAPFDATHCCVIVNGWSAG